MRSFFRVGLAVVIACAMPSLARAEFVCQCEHLFGAIEQTGNSTSLKADERPHYNLNVVNSMRLTENETAWTGSHWVFVQGGIVSRWQTAAPVPERLLDEGARGGRLPRAKVLNRIRALPQTELDLLSPAEKMDLYLGNYDFRISHLELEQRGPRRKVPPAPWEGFCNGLCAASINQPEPAKVVEVTNPDGIKVRFEPADLKALLSASYFYVEIYSAIGSPTPLSPNMDAGAFDVAMTRHLGEARQLFVLDIDNSAEIWNYVPDGYDRTPSAPVAITQPTPEMPAGTAFVSHVNMRVSLVRQTPVIADSNQATRARVAQKLHHVERAYDYELYLDAQERILGGKWLSAVHPDFAWFPRGDGTDQIQGTNPDLPFAEVKALVQKAKL